MHAIAEFVWKQGTSQEIAQYPYIVEFGCLYRKTAAHISLRSHNCFEFQYCLQGHRPWNVDSEFRIIKPNDVLFTRPWQTHTGSAGVNPPSSAFWIIIKPGKINNRKVIRLGSWWLFSKELEKKICRIFTLSSVSFFSHVPETGAIFDDLYKEIRCPSLGSEEAIRFLLSKLVLLAARKIDTLKLPDQNSSSDTDFHSFISQHISESLKIKKLAAMLQMEEHDFKNKIKKETGLYPHAYVNQLRLQKAAQLFKNKKNLSQIAVECGFCDQAHFSNFIKKFTGFTPKKYASILSRNVNK